MTGVAGLANDKMIEALHNGVTETTFQSRKRKAGGAAKRGTGSLGILNRFEVRVDCKTHFYILYCIL